MTGEEREALRRAIDRAARERLRAAREGRKAGRPGPRPRLAEEEAVDAVEALLADGLARTLTGIAREVGLARKTAGRALRVLVVLGAVEEISGDRPGWVAYRLTRIARAA